VIDTVKQRREFMRWVILLGLWHALPVGAWEEVLLSTVQGVWGDATSREVRLALEYLCDRKLIDLRKEPSGRWFADLNRYGVDIVEYTVACEPGIARPEKYT